MATQGRGAPKAEVIQQWADAGSEGASFERGRIDAAVKSICVEDPAGTPASLKDPRKGVKLKAADIIALTNEFLISYSTAQAALVDANGDMAAATDKLLLPPR